MRRVTRVATEQRVGWVGRAWIAGVFGFSVARALVVWPTLGDYGVNLDLSHHRCGDGMALRLRPGPGCERGPARRLAFGAVLGLRDLPELHRTLGVHRRRRVRRDAALRLGRDRCAHRRVRRGLHHPDPSPDSGPRADTDRAGAPQSGGVRTDGGSCPQRRVLHVF